MEQISQSTARNDFARERDIAKQRLVLIVVVQPVRMLDIVALLDAFSETNRLALTGPEYDVRVISGQADRKLTNRNGLAMHAATIYEECFDVADTLLVVGSDDHAARVHDEPFLNWLRWQVSRSRRIAAVSGGAFLLAEAGLLNGKRVTTHWQFREAISYQYPRVALERDVLYVRDANLYTCAGATAGIDLALSMIEEDLGALMANKVAQAMLLYIRRSGGAPQISVALRAQAMPANPITELVTWLPENLKHDLSVKNLARRSAMSPRNFARIFTRQVGLTPAKYVENLRLEVAQFQLESGELTVEGVAFDTGFENGETLRRLFVRRLGITPGRYRAMKGRVQKHVQAIRNSKTTGTQIRGLGTQLMTMAENRCSA